MFKTTTILRVLAIVFCLLGVWRLTAEAKTGPGVTATEIRIGNTNPYSGPASAYGTIGKALAAYFTLVNEQGGINGRKIRFITYDDGYSPPKTVEQARRLVEQDQVMFLFQPLGTPTNTAIHRYLNAKKVPQLFVASGATKWGQPKKYPWTMGWQPNYQTEGRIYAAYVLKHHPNGKIGILYQNDDYGKDYLEGFRQGLGSKTGMIVAQLSYEVSHPTVFSQVVALKNSGADIFFNVTTPKFAAQAIKKAHEIGWRPVHFLNNVSTSINAVLKPAGLAASEGIITSAYSKDPNDPQWAKDPARLEWLAWMKKYYPQGSTASSFNVYGYTVAQSLVHILRAMGDELTRENLMKQAASLKNLSLPMLLPGITLNTGPEDYYPIEQMQLMRFAQGTWGLFGEVISAK